MTKRTWWTPNASHPSERDLLLYVNGEGGNKLARGVRDHVEGCWSCSLKRERLAAAIAAFMKERESELGAEDLSEAAGPRFESRLRRLAQQAEAARATSRLGRSRRSIDLTMQFTLAVSLAVAIIALFWLRLSSVPSVSAREILTRAEQAEARRIEAVKEPIVHQKLQVTRLTNGQSSRSTYLEIWHDPKSNRWRQETEEAPEAAGLLDPKGAVTSKSQRSARGVADPLVVEFEEVLKSNEMHHQPISAPAFANWRAKLKRPEERVTETSLENGDKALTITTSAAEQLPKSMIVKAEMVFRLQDWHPVQHRLTVAESNGFRSYEIRERSFEVVALSLLGASIFEQPVVPAAVAPQASTVQRPPAVESSIDTLELEITLSLRLHQARACLGEKVQIERGAAGRPEVRGVVESAERKQELTRLFAEFRTVPVVLLVPGDDAAEPPGVSRTTEVATADEPGTQVGNGPSPLKDHLLSHFGRLGLPMEVQRSRTVEFSNRMITESESAYRHAWALRRLTERFSDVSMEKLSPSAAAMFRSMMRDHLHSLASIIGRCDEQLRPVLASLGDAASGTGASPGTKAENWPAYSMRVFESVMDADRRVVGLFGETDSTVNLRESSSALLVGLPRILEEIRAVDSQLSRLSAASNAQTVSVQPSDAHIP